MAALKFSNDSTWDDLYGPCLACPFCGSGYLHQGIVDAFYRPEDSETGIHCTVYHDRVQVDTSQLGNPSGRRDGIRIEFECEECGRSSEMHIIQHKGNTFIGFQSSFGFTEGTSEQP